MAKSLLKAALFWAVFFAILKATQSLQAPSLGRFAPMLAASLIIIATLAVIYVFLRRERVSFQAVGLGSLITRSKEFLVGTAAGVLLIVAMIGVVILVTPVEINAIPGANIAGVIVMSVLVFLLLSIMEEVAFRSYPLYKLRDAVGVRPAIYLSSVVFAFYHGLEVSNLLGPGVWGLFFGWMAFKTNSIAMPTGFHFALNWGQALVGEKSRYSDSIWTLSLEPGSGFLSAETVGLGLQVLLFIIGLVLVERLARRT